MEIHFLIGKPNSGKTVFVGNYLKNEGVNNSFHFDFKTMFNESYENKESQNAKIRELIASKDYDGQFFVELTIDNRLKLDDINIMQSDNQENIFIHLFDRDWNFMDPVINNNFIKHNFALIRHEGSDYDSSFDWNVIFTKEYLNFKMKYRFKDFEELTSSYKLKYDNGSMEFGHSRQNSITDVLEKVEDLPDISWIDGKRLEDKGRVIVCEKNYSWDWNAEEHNTVTYFSIPHLFKFLNHE